jgi:hypothetical protein
MAAEFEGRNQQENRRHEAGRHQNGTTPRCMHANDEFAEQIRHEQ